MRFFHFVAVSITILGSVFLSSCANHSNEYLKNGQQVNGVVVPPGIPMIQQETYYPAPNNAHSITHTPVSLVPPTLQAK